MEDSDITRRIQELVDEEHTLRSGDTPPDGERLRHLEERLDQCWDLLRQRRARQEFGDDPSSSGVRPTDTVENYQQ